MNLFYGAVGEPNVTPIGKHIIDLRRCLDRILEAPLESASNVKAEILQTITMDESGAKALAALAKDIEGNVFIVQRAAINAQVVHNSAKALRYLNDIEREYAEDGASLDMALEKMMKKGWRYPEIQELVKDKCYKIAEETCGKNNGKVNKTKIAEKLGIGRTTYLRQKELQGN